MKGKVYLVGAGPGDPELITIKAVNCIKKADVIIYDYLASTSFLYYANSSSEQIYVGKQGGDHTLSQDQINDLIVDQANQGKCVVRLKGGDPYIFGRGGEEAEILFQNGISFEIVPGITSGIAAATYAGIPLTHRKFASSLAFITGHEDPTKSMSSLDWPSLAKGIGTLVFYMGMKNLPFIATQLITHGKSEQTPVAIVRWGTLPKQQVVCGTLKTIDNQVKEAGLKAPAIIIVGDVVQLRDTLNWFEKKPLFGKSIVVTRAREQASDFVNLLSERGAECIECPTIQIVPIPESSPLNQAINHLKSYQWLVFTSVNGVKVFFDHLLTNGKDARYLGHIQTACIGPATAQELMRFGIKSDIIPSTYRAESIIEAFQNDSLTGKKILLPRAEEARPILPVELRKMGASVDEISIYKTQAVTNHAELILNRLADKTIDMITFTSSSTVKNFKALLPELNWQSYLDHVNLAAIGPVTAETAQNLGFTIDIISEEYTIQGLCNAITEYYRELNH